MDEQTVRDLALSFPETEEKPHFENTSFRVRKKIFATINSVEKRVCLKLSLADQDLYSLFDKTMVYPVPNKWGKQGWTLVDLEKVREEMLADAIRSAYCEVAPRKLTESLPNHH